MNSDTAPPSEAKSAAVETDRRRRPRMSTAAMGYLIADGVGDLRDPWEVLVRNISRLGVGFISSEKMDPGAICKLRIGNGPMRLARRVRVTHCAATEDGHFTIGVEFA